MQAAIPSAAQIAAVISMVKDIALAGAGIVAAIVAIRGLRTWRDELRGKADFEAAHTLARATFRLRDELQSCRIPLVRGSEYPDCYDPALKDSAKETQAWAHIFKNRWEPVRQALQEFDTARLEGEALWGDEIRTRGEALRRCAHVLFAAIEAIIDNHRAGGDHFEQDREFGRRMRSDAFASAEAKDNHLSQSISAAVADLESVLSSKMARSR